MLRGKLFRLIVLLSIAAFLCSCAPARVPLYTHPNLEQFEVKTISLMPVIDRRIDRSCEINTEESIREKAKKILIDKGYEVIMPAVWESEKSVYMKVITDMENEELLSLIPENADSVMLLYLNDLQNEVQWTALTPLHLYNIDISGKSFSKPMGLLWHDNASSTIMKGG